MLWVLRFWLTKVPIIGLWSIGVTSCGSARTRNQAIQLIFRPRSNVNYAIGFSLSSRDSFHNFPHNNKRKTVSNHLRSEIASWAPVPFRLLQSHCLLSGALLSLLQLYTAEYFSLRNSSLLLPPSRVIPELLRPNEKSRITRWLLIQGIYLPFSISRRAASYDSPESVMRMKICWRRNRIKEWRRRRRGTSERERLKLSWCLFIFSFYYLLARSDDTYFPHSKQLQTCLQSIEFSPLYDCCSYSEWWHHVENVSNCFCVIDCILLKPTFLLFCRLKREEGGGSIIIQAMAQPQQMQNIQQQSMDNRPMDHDEKKMRRQIANSNERRRMQSINAGFQSLRQLLPHHEGEKLSKVSLSRFFTLVTFLRPRPIPLQAKIDD